MSSCVSNKMNPHPVRRVRDLLKNTPEAYGLRQYSTAAGFAEMMECSASWIRNVECRATENWVSLAKRIEKKINVSADWLMSNPAPDEPVLDRSGKVWSPIDNLDPLAACDGMPDWRKLSQQAPSALPDLLLNDLRTMLVWELSLGLQDTVASVISIFKSHKTYKISVMTEMRDLHEQVIGKAFSSRVYAERNGMRVFPDDLESRLGVDLNRLTTKDAARILEDQGSGWILRLNPLPKTGPIIEMLNLHRISREDSED